MFPLLGLRVSPFTLWVPTLHTEGLQQSEVSSVQPASLRLRWVYVSAISVCFRTPRLSLGHPGSFKSAHGLKCMRTQTAPLFNIPRVRRGGASDGLDKIRTHNLLVMSQKSYPFGLYAKANLNM